MILLAAVTLVSVGIASGAALIGGTDSQPTRLTDRVAGQSGKTRPPEQRLTYAGDETPVRVVGAPFVPNTNPRER